MVAEGQNTAADPHTSAVEDVEPASQKYPARHGPEHDAVGSPTLEPKRPAGQMVFTPFVQ